MESLLAYWKPLADFAAVIAIATILRPGRKADHRAGDLASFGILMLIALGGVLFYYRDRF